MIVQPYIKGTLCATAHPEGCRKLVQQQVARALERPFRGPRTALVVGCSMGLGLAARIALGFGGGTRTLGVCLERAGAEGRTGTPGWYNVAAFEEAAAASGLDATTLSGDAFSLETKERAAGLLRERWGKIDLLVYSVAARQRRDPVTGLTHTSVLKAIGAPYTDKAVQAGNGEVMPMTLPVATADEIAGTVAVMGGDDWRSWIQTMQREGLLADGFRTVAFSYVGAERSRPTYRAGTIGQAKEHLEATARRLDEDLAALGGHAYAAVMKAMVTQSSLALPMTVLYSVLLAPVLREKGLHEGTIEQCCRLMVERLYSGAEVPLDAEGRIRLDDHELRPDVQLEVERRWSEASTANLSHLGDLPGWWRELMNLYGFEVEGVAYGAETDPVVPWPMSA